jgi:hypothetical protein
MKRLKGLAGELLACGCVVGVYETSDGRVVAMIDARGAQCDAHRLHGLLKARRATAARDDAMIEPAKHVR